MQRSNLSPISQTAKEVGELQILKFRSFVSKEEEGFVFIFNHQLSEIIFEDLLFQLFQPIFSDLYCPQVYYFSSTDQSLSYKEMIKMNDYIYVHFSERVQQYSRQAKYPNKLKIGNLEKLARGTKFGGLNLYIMSQKYYLLYGHDFFYNNINNKVDNLPLHIERKEIKYQEYCRQIENLKDNKEFMELKSDLQSTMQNMGQRLKGLELIANRYAHAKETLSNILKQSGIQIKSIKDLY